MLQTIIIGILLLAALFYLGRMVLRALKGDASCGGGCAKCTIAENKPTTVK